uniref:EF-hand domain-containing protein n=1 Tax=Branchiostoma floridae TaxID=7739 RepID=C3ZDD2_BRAFL|eukprot:XP_002593476.1 hypothetical protein BRAFLDRAFT_119517 [Branchiostoma floridae]
MSMFNMCDSLRVVCRVRAKSNTHCKPSIKITDISKLIRENKWLPHDDLACLQRLMKFITCEKSSLTVWCDAEVIVYGKQMQAVTFTAGDKANNEDTEGAKRETTRIRRYFVRKYDQTIFCERVRSDDICERTADVSLNSEATEGAKRELEGSASVEKMAAVEEMNKGLSALLDVLDTMATDKNKNGTNHLLQDKTKGVNAAWQGICKEYFGKIQGEDANAEAKQMAQIVSHLTRCKDAMCRLTADAMRNSQDVAQALDKEKNDTAQLRARVEDLGRELRSLQATNRNLQRQLEEKADEVKLQRALEDGLLAQIEAIKAENSETKARLQGRIKEINAHQKYFLACVNGLRTDVRFMTDNEAPMVRQRLELVHDAILDGQFSILSGKLPAHYSASEDDIRMPLGKMIKESAKPAPAESNGPSSTGTNSTIKEHDEPDDTSSEQTFDKEHPELINRATGRLDMYTALKCFPHMKESELKHHFDMFVKYDKSRDFNLDMGELVRALMTVAPGVKFTAAQIKELMKEVDVDDTGTIDFYEYLIIYNLLTKEGGKSEIFHREMSSTSKENVSKACVIQ